MPIFLRRKTESVLFSLALIVALASSAQTAPTEAQPKSQAPSALSKPSTPACPPPCLSPEQQAALVEVRKILKEARQVAEGIQITGGSSTSEQKLKIIQDYKAELISKIEKDQFQAGDFGTAATTKQPWYLALAQVKYGQVQEAIQTATRIQLHEDSLLALVKALVSTGHIEAAISVAQTNLPKERLEHWRYRNEAAVLSLIAHEQARAGDRAARETMQRALSAALAVKYPSDRVLAFIHVARAQSAVGDQAGSTDSFQQAIKAALAIRRNGTPTSALTSIAVAQAESGDQAGSAQTFREAIRLTNDSDAQARAFRLVRTACEQVVHGQRATGAQTFQQAFEIAEGLPTVEKGRVLREIGQWQLKAGEREALAGTLEQARKAGVDVVDLAVQAGYLRLAMELTESISDQWYQSGALAYIARRLVETKDPFGTPEVFQRLLQTAMTLFKKPSPQDESKAKLMLMNIALVQVSAGDLSGAFHTIGMISNEGVLASYAYPSLIQLLTKQGNLAGARQVADGLKEDWIFGGTSEANNRDALCELAKLGIRSGDIQDTLAWARKQPGSFARSYALLGMAEALMEQQGIEDIGKVLSQTPLRAGGMSPCA